MWKGLMAQQLFESLVAQVGGAYNSGPQGIKYGVCRIQGPPLKCKIS